MLRAIRLVMACLAVVAATAGQVQAAAILYGVTGDGADFSEALFTLNLSNANPTLLTRLGNGDDGEAIAFNTSDGLIYHWSGLDTQVFETVDPVSLAVTNIGISGNVFDEVRGATYDAVNNRFLFVDLDNFLFTQTAAGTATGPLGPAQSPQGTGLAFVGSTLYEVFRSTDDISTVNPLTSTTITLAGETILGATGLATNPDTNVLYALLRIRSTSGRELVTIDPTTGVATSVGNTGDSFADIAFSGAHAPAVPEPSTFALLGIGAVCLLGFGRRRKRKTE